VCHDIGSLVDFSARINQDLGNLCGEKISTGMQTESSVIVRGQVLFGMGVNRFCAKQS
jgi:hypothetical protein